MCFCYSSCINFWRRAKLNPGAQSHANGFSVGNKHIFIALSICLHPRIQTLPLLSQDRNLYRQWSESRFPTLRIISQVAYVKYDSHNSIPPCQLPPAIRTGQPLHLLPDLEPGVRHRSKTFPQPTLPQWLLIHNNGFYIIPYLISLVSANYFGILGALIPQLLL